jgi:hypothetical protein
VVEFWFPKPAAEVRALVGPQNAKTNTQVLVFVNFERFTRARRAFEVDSTRGRIYPKGILIV